MVHNEQGSLNHQAIVSVHFMSAPDSCGAMPKPTVSTQPEICHAPDMLYHVAGFQQPSMQSAA